MAYTEIKIRNERKYYYRVVSVRKGEKISKKRKYLGVNLSKEELFLKEKEADSISNLISKTRKKGILEKIKPKIIEILKRNNVKRAGIFGSYSEGEYKKDSDIDILIEPPKGIGLGFVRIQLELQDKLKKKVDLLTYKSIHPLLKGRILNQEIRII